MNMSILLIDDNPKNNSGYIDELKKYYDVTVAMRLMSAERLMKSHHYDIIIIDVMMSTQYLKSNSELTAGFDFYSERLKPLLDNQNKKPLIVFWSRFYSDIFDMYFGEHKPDNVFFLHKDDNVNHLLNGLDLLLR